MPSIQTRQGDGTRVELSQSELRRNLTDPIVMNEVRGDLSLGLLHPRAGSPKCMEAKFNIADLLGIDINCVRRFRENASL
jgi:dimethylamine--corrinoid protein Co-methyltransferase